MTRILTRPTAPPAARSPLLSVRDLAVSFHLEDGRVVQAVDGVSLTVHPGQTLALVGESGCGKSVTALSVLRLISSPPGRVDRGEIRFGARDLLRLPMRQMLHLRGREIAMIFQEPMSCLDPVYNVGDQVMEAVRLHQKVSRREVRDIALASMRDVGILHPHRRLQSYPHQFSGGMQQRVMIAMALACRPRLLLADEPTTALDVTIQAQILELLGELQQSRNMAMMLITHDLGVVAEHADVVCVIYAGRVVEYTRVDALFRCRYHPYTRGLLSCIPKLHERRPRLTTVEDVVSDPDQFRRLPGYQYGIVPWWPRMDPPEDLADAPPAQRYCLHEIDPGHWVGCWRTEYLRQHPRRLPDVGPETEGLRDDGLRD